VIHDAAGHGQADMLRRISLVRTGHDPHPARPASHGTVVAMKLSAALSLIAVVALLTPVAAMLGMYETSYEEFARFAAPALGAGAAIAAMRFFGRRTER
jgi:hypothetical protein